MKSAPEGLVESNTTSEGTLNLCNEATSGHVILNDNDFLVESMDASDFGLREGLTCKGDETTVVSLWFQS